MMFDEEMQVTLLSLSTAMLADARVWLEMAENHLDAGIRPVVPFSRMAGCAVTVELEMVADATAADLSVVVQAYQEPGVACPIIVIQIPEVAHHQGIFGEGAATMARRSGYVGALVEGAVRDSHELRDMAFPAFSRCVAPGYIVGRVAVKAVGEPVLIGGRTIGKGDVILADNDGVMAVAAADLEAVVEKALAIKEWEIAVHSQVAAGRTNQAIEVVGPMP